METKRTIDYRFKILYAIGALMIVCGHVKGGSISLLTNWFPYYGLHLPLFVFCSGYFYNHRDEQQPAWKYLLKKCKKFLLPLFIYNVVYGLIVLVSRRFGFTIGGDFTLYNLFVAPLTSGHQFTYNMGGWFLVPLFMVEVFTLLCRRLLYLIKVKLPEWVLFAASLALGIAGNLLAINGYNTVWWLTLVRMLHFLPFFGLGIFFKSTLEKYDRKIPTLWYIGGIFALKLAIAFICGRMPRPTPPRGATTLSTVRSCRYSSACWALRLGCGSPPCSNPPSGATNMSTSSRTTPIPS